MKKIPGTLYQIDITSSDTALIDELTDIYENYSYTTQALKTGIFRHTFDETMKRIELIDIIEE